MNTQHLKYALEVERTGSITQAADAFFMAQPNLSKAIKELEEDLGITIFKRTSRGVTPTAQGARFLDYARAVLATVEQMEALRQPEDTTLQRAGIVIPRGSYLASGLTRFLGDLNPDGAIDVSVKETNSLQAIADVTEGRFPLGVIRYQLDYRPYFLDYLKDKGLASDPIWEFEMLAVLSRRHPLAGAEQLNARDLEPYIEIVHGDTAVPYLAADERSGQPESRRRITLYERCSQFDILTHVPTSYMWVSPIPQEWIDRYELVQRRCADHVARYVDALIYPAGYAFTALDRRLIDRLYASKNEVAYHPYQ